jgi:hypothetical protein
MLNQTWIRNYCKGSAPDRIVISNIQEGSLFKKMGIVGGGYYPEGQ